MTTIVLMPQVFRTNVQTLRITPATPKNTTTTNIATMKKTAKNAQEIWDSGKNIQAVTAGDATNKYIAGIRDVNIKTPATNQWIKLTGEALLEKAIPKKGSAGYEPGEEGTSYGD